MTDAKPYNPKSLKFKLKMCISNMLQLSWVRNFVYYVVFSWKCIHEKVLRMVVKRTLHEKDSKQHAFQQIVSSIKKYESIFSKSFVPAIPNV